MYTYPDHQDYLTSKMIESIELYPGYWKDSENRILDIAKNHIQKHHKTLLDIGCGEGRLLWEFEPCFENIIAIDPDTKRLQVAQENAKKKNLSHKIAFQNTTVDYIDTRVDAILCSHVLQHISTDYLPVLFSKIKDILHQNGLLIITTCHSTMGEDYYTKQYWQDGLREEHITEDQFNSLTRNSKNILPHHHFTFNTLNNLVWPMKITESQIFHITDDFPALNVDEITNTMSYFKSRHGRDIMITASW